MENELFRVTAEPTRVKLFFKKKNEVTVFTDRVEFEFEGDKNVVFKNDIINVFVKEPVTSDVETRTTVFEFYSMEEEEDEDDYEEDEDYEDDDDDDDDDDNDENDEDDEDEEFGGSERVYSIEDGQFDNFSRKMEEVLKREWKSFADKKRMTDSERWINTANAVFLATDNCDPEIWGGMFISPVNARIKAEMLERSWRIKNEKDGDEMVNSLLNFRTGVQGLEGWDLQRAIHVSCSAYICGYFTKEKAYHYALEAAKKLQKQFTGWDAYMRSYLNGYCYWSGDDINDPATNAYERSEIYRKLRNLPNNPFRLNWNMPLS
ncbi:MAG: DUF1266 domain-containing protein [Tannerella sp.]|jgi:hypothetical protein|nr:DUF1266 domain-containing protein [Tannerella sp.]